MSQIPAPYPIMSQGTQAVGVCLPGQVTLTRPANATAYSANQVVASLTSNPILDWTFPIGRIANGTGYITKAILATNQSTCTANFRLHLWNISTIAPIADGGNMAVLFANMANYQGFIDFPAVANNGGSGDNCAQAVVVPGVVGKLVVPSIPLEFTCDSSFNIYGLLCTLSAFTPASGQEFFIGLSGDDN